MSRGRRALLGLALWSAALPAGAAEPIAGLPPVVIAAPAVIPSDDTAWRERLLRYFLDGTMRSERMRERRLARWAGPIELSLHGDGMSYVAFVADLAAELSPLIRLPITVTDDPQVTGNMDIFVASSPGWWPPGARMVERQGRVFTCAAAPSIRDGRIVRTRIMINAGVLTPSTVRACLLEEVVQSLGLLGEIDDADGSVLSDQVGYERLGVIDRLLLRTLYDPRLVPNSDREAARPVATVILGEALKELACPTGACPPPAPDQTCKLNIVAC